MNNDIPKKDASYNYIVLEQGLDFLNSLIDLFEDLSWDTQSAEHCKRLERARECLRKAYVYASPILYL